MKIRTYPRFLLFFLLLPCYFTHAQDNPAADKLSAYARHFTAFSKEYPQEKVYLHFDNTAYYMGETMWFKAYVVRAEHNTLSQLSKTLYVELVTPQGIVLESKKMKIDNGQCHGDFLLKDSLTGGFYEVRAYTRYMLNQEKEYLFSRVFAVYDKPKKAGDYNLRKMWERPYTQRVPTERPEFEQKGKLSLTFYPEGGNLIEGLESRVAFKATGKDGESAFVSGYVYDARGDSVTEISTSYQGMGMFNITPGAGTYVARVDYHGKEYSFALPVALAGGYVLSLDNPGEGDLEIVVQKTPSAENETLGLTLTSRGKLYAFETVETGAENAMTLTCPERLLPTGVVQATLFNSRGQVLAERMAFVNHHSQLRISVMQDRPTYEPYGKVNLDFQVRNMNDTPLETTFSLSVRDAGATSFNPYADNLLANLLLCSELRGYIENPAYYFESDAPARRAALDLLMLTQGWSRYVWKQLAGVDTFAVKHPVEKSLVVEGRVLSITKKKPKADVEVLMFMTLPDSTSQRGTCLTDNEGKFNFSLTDFSGKASLTLQTREKGKRTENNIVLDRAFSPAGKVYAYAEKEHPQSLLARRDSIQVRGDSLMNGLAVETQEPQPTESKLPLDKKNLTLKEVSIKGKKTVKREAEALRNASVVYDVEKEMDEIIDKGENEPVSALDFIQTKNPYFSYRLDRIMPPHGSDYTEDGIRAYYKGKPVILCVNNHSLAAKDNLGKVYNALEPDFNCKDISSNEIQTITINEKSGVSFLYSGKAGDLKGDEVVIFIYTYKDLHTRNGLDGIRQTKYQGYSFQREFFNPNYEHGVMPNEKDYRRTLYWNPNVRTDADGNATVSFYNNGSCKAMNISAETVMANGVIGVLNK